MYGFRALMCAMVTLFAIATFLPYAIAVPAVEAIGEKIRLSADDVLLRTQGRNPTDHSLLDVVSAVSAAVQQNVEQDSRITEVEALMSNATMEDDDRDQLIANSITATNRALGQLQGQVDQLISQMATKAEVQALTNLETALYSAILNNSTAMIQQFADCQASGGQHINGACQTRVRVNRAYTCNGASTQQFTVPAGVTSIHIQAWGGGGAGSGWNTGGAGGYAEGDYVVTPGTRLTVAVACPGPANQVCMGICVAYYTSGWPGLAPRCFAGSPGGGFSGIFSADQISAANAVIIAGGGGGGGGGPHNTGGHMGGAGGGDTAEDAVLGAQNGADYCDNGGGGTQQRGGTAGCMSTGGRTGQTAGSALLGGQGEDGGCGGSGYFGGGGGTRAGNWIHAGGGGGSNYVGRVQNATSLRGHLSNLPAAATSASGYINGIGQGGVGRVGGPGLIIISYWNTN